MIASEGQLSFFWSKREGKAVKRWKVSLPCNPEKVVEAKDYDGAVEAYKNLCGIITTKSEFSVTEIEPVTLPGELGSLGLEEATAWQLAGYGLTTRAAIIAFGNANQGLTKAGLTKDQEEAVAKALNAKAAKASNKTVKEEAKEEAAKEVKKQQE